MNISKKLKLSFASAIALPLLIIAALVISQTQLDKLRTISSMVFKGMERSIETTNKTVELAHSAQQQFSEITASIVHISDLNTQIATAAEEQQHVAEDINRNVTEIKNAADEVSDIAVSTSENGIEMNRLSSILTGLVGKFKV